MRGQTNAEAPLTPIVTDITSQVGSGFTVNSIKMTRVGKIVTVSIIGAVPQATGVDQPLVTGLPRCTPYASYHSISANDYNIIGNIWINPNTTTILQTVAKAEIFWKSLTYVTNDP